jgi:hypothetical protein
MIDVVIQYIVGFLTSVGGGAVGMYVGFYILRKKGKFIDVVKDSVDEIAADKDSLQSIAQIGAAFGHGLRFGLGSAGTKKKGDIMGTILEYALNKFLPQVAQGQTEQEQPKLPF